jgi:hypothetical protein
MGTDFHLKFQRKYNDKWEKIEVPACLYPDERNYLLFAFLAGVRNGKGFAGVHIFDPIKPNFEGRGLPKDFFLEKGEFLGDHSFTHATVAEILQCDWNVVFTETGYVDRSQYKDFKEKGYPRSWCGDISGPNINKTDSLIEFETDPTFTHIRVNWQTTPLKDCYFYLFCDEILPRLTFETSHWDIYDLENLRIIMGFDS